MLALKRLKGQWLRFRFGTLICWVQMKDISRGVCYVTIDGPTEIEVLRAELVPAHERPDFVEVR